MSSITFADNKLGGRVTACCDAIAAGHLNRAAGIFAELADELNVEATEAALLSEETEVSAPVVQPEPAAPQLAVSAQPVDMQMCARNVHSYSAPDPHTGWSKCAVCGTVSVVGHNQGPYDMSARQ